MKQWAVHLTDETHRLHLVDALRSIARLGGGNEARVFLEQLITVVARGAYADAAYIAMHEGDSVETVATWASTGWPLRIGRHGMAGSIAAMIGGAGPMAVASGALELIRNDVVMAGCTRTEALIVEAIRFGETDKVIGHIALLYGTPQSSTEEAQSLIALGAARAGVEFSRLNALEALLHSEQKFFSIFQSSPVPIMVVNRASGACLDINKAFISSFGFKREELIGRSADAMRLFADDEARTQLETVLSNPAETVGLPLRLQTHDDEIRECQLHAGNVKMDEEPCVLLAIVDVTSLQQVQRQVEDLNHSLERRVVERTHDLAATNSELEETLTRLKHTLDELMRSEKLAALGSLVAGITHELNTPIGNSLMVASTLRDVNRSFRYQMEQGLKRSVLDNYVRESDAAADILMRNLHRAGELISSFKQVAVDQTSSKRREFDLAEVISEIVITMQPLFRNTPIVVESSIPSGIRMHSYPGPLGQVVTNLLNNTILHAFEGRDSGKVLLSAEPEGDELIVLKCVDDGVGISPGNMALIFEPFFTTRVGRNGTGLGLNIVHNIVTSVLGGEILVDSKPGRGCVFTLRIPLDAPEPSQDLDLHVA